MILTIDGPAGTGKSSVAQDVAAQLGFDFLDTGAMYRAVALAAIRRGTDLQDENALGLLANQLRIDFDFSRKPPTIRLDQMDVSREIRTQEIGSAASLVAKAPGVRQVLVREQQAIGRSWPNLVTEGRDQGSVVFPDAAMKFYLDASVAERARRRAAQLRQAGKNADEAELRKEIEQRDHQDATRAVAPLRVPQGAIVIDTTSLTQQQVVERIVQDARRLAHG